MLLVLTLLTSFVVTEPPQSVGVSGSDALQRASRQVIDGGYRSDVPALQHALTELKPLFATPDLAARAAYFSGFANWQLALTEGTADPRERGPYLDRAISDLQVAVNLNDADAEATLLLGHCYGLKRSFDPKGDPVIQLQAIALRSRAKALAPTNPRVVLIDAMGLYYRPAQVGGNREAGLARWREALDLFAKAAPATDVGWGHSEAYLWLANVYANTSAPDQARVALEKALALRPDFVAAQRALAALPRE